MTPRPAALVTDIEGTTSDIAFVQKVMFPYARKELPGFVRAHADDPEVAPWIAQIAGEIHTTPDNLAAVMAALWSWIDADRKHTALKALQGLVWQQAFREGLFHAHVYPDAIAALNRWHTEGLPLYVYSSGSVQAQKLYFGHTESGDLRPCFSGYFDTTTGPKREAESYRRIAGAIGVAPEGILFLSDIGAELDAARDAGWRTVQVLREGATPAPEHPSVASFDELHFLMRELLRTFGAGLLLVLLMRPPAAWRIRPAAHFWWLLLVGIGLSIVRDRMLQREPMSFYVDGIQGDALGALLVLAAAALVGAWSGQRVLTWSMAVLASAASLWIAALLEAARFALKQYFPNHLGVELVLTVVPCACWLLAWLGMTATLLPQWRWWRHCAAALVSASLTLAPFFMIEPVRYWYPAYDESSAEYTDTEAADESRTVKGSAEKLIYRQPALVEQAIGQLAAGTPGVTDAYLLAFGGDANEDVFRNEVEYAQTLFAQRFGMQRRTLVLLNNPDTTAATPLATLSNLRLALAGIGAKMDRKEDLLVLFMTTHGSEDHQLFVDLQPLALDWINPTDLRAALDGAGIDWRVVIVAACYSGGFIDALATPMSLVITAARADRPSFGCGSDAELTYFGRAFLVDALNRTTSLPSAFELARETVAQREKDDGFEPSEPQMSMGALIGPRLQSWTRQLPPSTQVAFVPAVPKEACAQTKDPCP